jgi:hypothetical protein
MQRLAKYVPKLLETIQLLDQDRKELYKMHLKVASDGKTAKELMGRKSDLEYRLRNIYQQLDSSELAGHTNEIYSLPVKGVDIVGGGKPKEFVILCLTFWVLGIFSALLIREYVSIKVDLGNLPNSDSNLIY